MKPQIGEIWEPEGSKEFGPIEILSKEWDGRKEGCYNVRFLRNGRNATAFRVVNGRVKFKCSKQANLENK